MSFLKAKDLDNIKTQEDCLGPNERIFKENHYSKMFISCPSVSPDVFIALIDKINQNKITII